MNLEELQRKAELVMSKIKNDGLFPKENYLIDYKEKLNIIQDKSPTENFLMSLAKDIISFANSDGGIIILGIEETSDGRYIDTGLSSDDIDLLDRLDFNDINQRFEKITKSPGINIDLKKYRMGARTFYYLIIEKSYQIVLPQNDFQLYKLYKGNIYYRASGCNQQANKSTSHFNTFLQVKANERSKEFMEIWSNLLPEMVDINPREILIVNPSQDKVYGFNSKDNKLSGSDVEIENEEDGVFRIILNAISASEIGRLTTNEGKPLYKIVGKISQDNRERINLSSLVEAVKSQSTYKFTTTQLKSCLHYLGWVDSPKFKVENPPDGTVNQDEFGEYIFVGVVDDWKDRKKVFFSPLAIEKVLPVINDESLHMQLFNKKLSLNN